MSLRPPDFTPYPWQLEAAKRVATQGKLACGAEPGAGKTAAALLAAQGVGAQVVWIVSPAKRVAAQWAREAHAWGYDAVEIGGPGRGERKLVVDAVIAQLARTGPLAIIVPWSRMRRKADARALLDAFESEDLSSFDLLVVDESHYAQGAEETVGGRALLGYYNTRKKTAHRGLRHYASRCIGLTGTPVTSRPALVRTQLLLAGLDADRSTYLYSKRQYEAHWWGGKMQYHYGAKRELWTTEEFSAPGHEALVSRGMLLVEAEELARQLPAHRRVLLRDFEAGAVPEEVTRWAEQTGGAGKLPMLEDLADIRQETTQTRLPAIADYVAEWHSAAEAGRMLVVLAMYQASTERTANVVRTALAKAEGSAGRRAAPRVTHIHGGVADAARAQRLQEAIDGRARVLVATHGSIGTGVDGLQYRANRALCIEAPWTPGEAAQSEGRLFRTGQTRPVLTEWIAAGVEGVILRGIGLKEQAIETLLGRQEAPETAPAPGPGACAAVGAVAWEDL